jgi:hypothetical protein
MQLVRETREQNCGDLSILWNRRVMLLTDTPAVRFGMIPARLSERVIRVRAVTVSGKDRLEIVWIDQAPLRANAAAECTDMMMRLERARLGWHQFERQDKPAFIRWRAREFGALLSTARDVEDKIRDAQNLIHEVEIEMRRHI